MANFDSKDTSSFRGVWVFCEQRDGQLIATGYQLLSEGRKLADDLNQELVAVVLGSNINEDYIKSLGGYGADKVLYCNNRLLEVYTTEAYTKVICDLVMERKPEILLMGASNIGRDLAPRCAARLQTGLTADCTSMIVDLDKYKDYLRSCSTIDVDNTNFEEGSHLKVTRPAFGGHLMATIVCPRFRPQMATVRPGVMKTSEFDKAGAARTIIENITTDLSEKDISVEVLEVKKVATQLVDIIGADIVVAVGRGIASDHIQGLALAHELADVLGGVVGCSRAITDAGWMSIDRQIGQTGNTVHPRIYIALGISGAIQHTSGMENSQCIISINKNDNAPIFNISTFGITGDLFKVTPMLIEAIKELKASQ